MGYKDLRTRGAIQNSFFNKLLDGHLGIWARITPPTGLKIMGGRFHGGGGESNCRQYGEMFPIGSKGAYRDSVLR